ncbi:hypothetical protein WN48_10033 [Eufriesea mexicana]|nr:hypothetical protein WN48_10033 [Eufriesea mexicana]
MPSHQRADLPEVRIKVCHELIGEKYLGKSLVCEGRYGMSYYTQHRDRGLSVWTCLMMYRTYRVFLRRLNE